MEKKEIKSHSPEKNADKEGEQKDGGGRFLNGLDDDIDNIPVEEERRSSSERPLRRQSMLGDIDIAFQDTNKEANYNRTLIREGNLSYIQLAPDDKHIYLKTSRLWAVVKFFNDIREFKSVYPGVPFNILAHMSKEVINHVVAKADGKITKVDLYNHMCTKDIVKWIIKSIQPKDKLTFIIYMENNIKFTLNIPGYKPTVLDYGPFRHALYEYKETFEMLYDIMTKYNTLDNIPPINNKEGGVVRVWLGPLGSYGHVVNTNLEQKTYEKLSTYLDSFFKVIEVHSRFADRAKQLQLALGSKNSAAFTALASKPLKDTNVHSSNNYRGANVVHHMNESFITDAERVYMDEIDDILQRSEYSNAPVANYADYDNSNDEDSAVEFDHRIAELNYVPAQHGQDVTKSQTRFNKVFNNNHSNVQRKDTSSAPHRDIAERILKKRGCYMHLLLKKRGSDMGCTNRDCKYSHDEEAMKELWSEVYGNMDTSPYKSIKKLNNVNSLADQDN